MDKSLLKKLHIKVLPDKILILNCPLSISDEFENIFEPSKIISKPEGKNEIIFLFASNSKDLNEFIAIAIECFTIESKLWICYPKPPSGIKTDLNRDKLWKLIAEKGFGPVSQVSLSDEWSAMRFKPENEIKRQEKK